MEASALWIKGRGLIVLEECTLGKEIYGRPHNYRFKSVVIDYLNRRMWAHDVSESFYWFGKTRLPVQDTVVSEYVSMEISKRSSVDLLELIPMMNDFFGHCTPQMTTIAICELQNHRFPILDRVRNWIPSTMIQRAWKRCVSDPSYQVCRRRLMNEFQVDLVF